jgi:V-type H+-transporting ATPase subunit A
MQPLSVELGPGILNNIFDGIQRPLKAIAVASGDCFIPRGVAVPALDVVKQWEFHPTTFKVREGGSSSNALALLLSRYPLLSALPHPTSGLIPTPQNTPCTSQVGDRITAGDIYGVVFENSLVEHRIMLPPGARGNISHIAPAGHYTVEEEVIEVDFQGVKKVRMEEGRFAWGFQAGAWGLGLRKHAAVAPEGEQVGRRMSAPPPPSSPSL